MATSNALTYLEAALRVELFPSVRPSHAGLCFNNKTAYLIEMVLVIEVIDSTVLPFLPRDAILARYVL